VKTTFDSSELPERAAGDCRSIITAGSSVLYRASPGLQPPYAFESFRIQHGISDKFDEELFFRTLYDRLHGVRRPPRPAPQQNPGPNPRIPA
jgi:hypothetical protein